MINKIAGNIQLFPAGSKLEGKGPLGLEGLTTSDSLNTFAGVVSSVIGLLTIVAAIWFIFQLLTGGLSIMSAGGDKAKATQAKSQITSSLIGLLVVTSGIFIFALVGELIGVNIFNLTAAIFNLRI